MPTTQTATIARSQVEGRQPKAAQPDRMPIARSRHDSVALAAGYTRLQHVLNTIGLVVFCGLAGWIGLHVFSRPLGVAQFGLGLVAGWIATDFACGLLHWAGDTWGRTNMPVVGRMIVRTFREHHADPAAITRHGAVQVLGEQAIIASPVIVMLKLFDPAADDTVGNTLLVGLYTLLVGSMAANLLHRWAHMRKPPLIARVLQRAGIVISFRQHARHHCPPYTQSYCIAIGWLNPLLDRIRFWRALEWLVWKTTGAIPREDDLGPEAALALMRARSR